MSVTIKARKCKNGSLKNHISHIAGVEIKWDNGVAVTEREVWDILKNLPGYEMIDSENGGTDDREASNDNDTDGAKSEINDHQSFEAFCPLKKRDKVSDYEDFAKKNGIDLGDAATKDEMMAKIEAFYEEKTKS